MHRARQRAGRTAGAATTGEPSRPQVWVRVGLVVVLGLAVWNASTLPSTAPADVDGAYYLTAAWNLATQGVYSTSRDGGDLEHHAGREPLLPALLAVAMRLDDVARGGDVLDELDVDCVVEGSSSACRAPNRRWKWVNGALYLLVVAATWVLARQWLTSGWALVPVAAVATSTGLLGYVDTYYTEVLAALLLLAASGCLVVAGRQRSVRWALGAGACLGLLALTKAIFAYAIPLVAVATWCVLGLRTSRQDRRQARRLVIALVVAGLVLPGAWMARNAAAGEGWVITRGADAVAMTRLSYDTITAREAAAAIVYWSTPTDGPRLAEAVLPDSAHRRLDRDEPDGYYQGHERVRDEVARDGLATAIRRRLIAHILITPLLAYRGTVPWSQFDVPSDAITIGALASELIGRLFLPALAVLTWWAVRRHRPDQVLLVTPVLTSFALYAGFTHFMPRYSVPSVPVAAIALTLVLQRPVRRVTDPWVSGDADAVGPTALPPRRPPTQRVTHGRDT